TRPDAWHRSRTFLVALLQPLLEGGELGERRIGVGLAVAAIGAAAVGPRVVLLALRAVGTLVTAPARPALVALPPIGALALAFAALLAIMALPARLPIGTIASPVPRRARQPFAFGRLRRDGAPRCGIRGRSRGGRLAGIRS